MDEPRHVVAGQLPVLEQPLLHAVDRLDGASDVCLGPADDQIRLAGRNLDPEAPTQQAKMAIGRTEQFKLPTRV